jgi:hypothetical protein
VIYALAAGGADVNRVVRNKMSTPLVQAVCEQKELGAARALLELGADSTFVALMLSRPPALLLPTVVDEPMRALVARYRRGGVAPARACSLPDCEARRRADYDDKKLLKCPCMVRSSRCEACSVPPGLTHPCSYAQLALYCCKEHQLADRKRHKAACKAALEARAS